MFNQAVSDEYIYWLPQWIEFLIKAEAVYKEQILPSPVSSHLATHLGQAQTTNAEGTPCQLDLGLCYGLGSPTAHLRQAQLQRGRRRLYQKISVAVTDYIISVHSCKSYAINAVSGFTKKCFLVMYQKHLVF